MLSLHDMENIEEIRKRINGIDEQLASLFERRMAESRKVAEFKMERGLPVLDPVREAEVIKKNAALVEDDTVREYFINFENSLMSLSRDYQQKLMSGMKVAYGGLPGAFAYTAATRMFPGAELVPFPDFEQAYRACVEGVCDVVVLPFENSFAGEVSTVTDLMFSGSLYVNRVMEVEAVQNLLACEGATLDSVKEVASHPQALTQCSKFIKDRGYGLREFPSTATAAKTVAAMKDPGMAAIASLECAELYGLKVLESHINSSSSNTTRFASFSRVLHTDESKRKMDRHFILMFTVKNEAGSLAKTLNIIGAHGYNMCSLRSRPMKDLMWNYYFYIELDGNVNTREGRGMMTELGTICERLKLVGSF